MQNLLSYNGDPGSSAGTDAVGGASGRPGHYSLSGVNRTALPFLYSMAMAALEDSPSAVHVMVPVTPFTSILVMAATMRLLKLSLSSEVEVRLLQRGDHGVDCVVPVGGKLIGRRVVLFLILFNEVLHGGVLVVRCEGVSISTPSASPALLILVSRPSSPSQPNIFMPSSLPFACVGKVAASDA